MPLYQEALQRILPVGGDLYVALLTTAPGIDGTGETEASYTGYARVLHSSWGTHTDTGGWYGSNSGAIVFSAVTGADITVRAWGLYVDGKPELVASGPMMNGFGVVAPQLLLVGDEARFPDDALKIRTGS